MVFLIESPYNSNDNNFTLFNNQIYVCLVKFKEYRHTIVV